MSHLDLTLTARDSNADLQLTQAERQLIIDFRAMQRCAQQMIVDSAAQYRCILPAERVRLTLVG